MAKSNDEIYDLLVGIDKKVDSHVALSSWRLDKLEDRSKRGIQFWLAVLASPITGAVLAYWGIRSGAG